MAKRNEKPPLKEALSYYRRGWSIIPTRADTKKPAIRSWKQYQTKRPDEKQLRKWFADGKHDSLAVVCGAVSGGLAVLDLDSEQRCKWWKDTHPKLAQALPSVSTRKGEHFYFRSEPFRKKNGDEVDLLCEGAYVVLPPSPEKSWLTPLNGKLPLLDPFEWGLEQFGINRPNTDRKVTEHAEHTEQAEHTDTIRVCVVIDSNILSLIDKTLPRKYRQRNSRIFYLALGLKCLDGYWNVDPKCFRNVVREWHTRALPYIRTKPFLDTWLEFLVAWRNIMYKKIDPKQIFEVCSELEPPAKIVEDWPGYPELWQLCLLCRELHNAHQVFGSVAYLSCRKIEEVLGISHNTASKYFRTLTLEGYVAVVSKGKMTPGGGVATRFRYIAA